jgi:hypothetical protein
MNTTTLPEFSRDPVNLDFCQSKDTYVKFVREWKEQYRQLSKEIRYEKLASRAASSEAAKPGNPRAKLLLERAGKDPGLPSPYLNRNRNNYWFCGGEFTWGRKALANFLLNLRKEAKVAANEAWKRARLSAA